MPDSYTHPDRIEENTYMLKSFINVGNKLNFKMFAGETFHINTIGINIKKFDTLHFKLAGFVPYEFH